MSNLVDRIREGGPGWLQGAMTLGGGSAITSLSIGAMFGYEYLWVQPVAMIIGCIMLFALAHQTLSTGERPLPPCEMFSPSVAWLWYAYTRVECDLGLYRISVQVWSRNR